MHNIIHKKHYAGDKEDILDNPQVIEFLSKYTEEIRERPLTPEEFINDHCYTGPARQEVLREMRFAATLERIYSNQRYQNDEILTKDRMQRTIAETNKIVLNK